MKPRILYLLLSSGVVAMIVTVALLSRSLFSISIEPPRAHKAQDKAHLRERPPKVIETLVDDPADPPATPDSAPEPAPLAPAPQPSTPVAAVPPPPTLPGIGAVALIHGTAVDTGTGKTSRVLVESARIFLNDKIETGPSAKLKIKFEDGSVLSQGENSTILIDGYVYAPDRPAECRFAMRLMKGTCRIITALIAKANPDRFAIRTRMATVGIRGCDVAFRSSTARDDVYVMELGGEKEVSVTAAKDGSPLFDPATGNDLQMDDANKQTVNVVRGGTGVSVLPGRGIVSNQPISMEDLRAVEGDTSFLTPARHDLIQRSNSATFSLHPREGAPSKAGGSGTAK